MDNEEAIKIYLKKAWGFRVSSNYKKATTNLENARSLCALDDHFLLGRIAHINRQIAADQDQWELAAEFGWKAIEYYRKSGKPQKIAHALRHQADIMCRMDRTNEGHVLYQKALGLYREHSDTSPNDMANALRAFALLLVEQGNKIKALETWQEAAELYGAIGLIEGVKEAEEWVRRLGTA